MVIYCYFRELCSFSKLFWMMGNTAFLDALTFAWLKAVKCSFSPDDSTTSSDKGGSVDSQSTWHIYHSATVH